MNEKKEETKQETKQEMGKTNTPKPDTSRPEMFDVGSESSTIKFFKADEMPIYKKILVYGDSGIGKTSLAKTVPDPIVIDTEKGTLSLIGSKIDIAQIVSLSQMKEVYEFLLKESKSDKRHFQTIFLDSGTEFQRRMLSDYMQNSGILAPDWDTYEYILEQTRRLIRLLKDLPYHFVVTALPIQKKVEGEQKLMPDFIGKIAREIGAIFDFVFYYTLLEDESGEKKRVLCTQPSNYWVAKSRINSVPKFMKPSLDPVIQINSLT